MPANRTRATTTPQAENDNSERAVEVPTTQTLIRRRDTRTGVVIRVAPSHPFANDSGWETIADEKSA